MGHLFKTHVIIFLAAWLGVGWYIITNLCSGRSRISRRGGVDLLAGAWTSNVGTFSLKMYVKMKELGPVGGHVPGTPPRSANAL